MNKLVEQVMKSDKIKKYIRTICKRYDLIDDLFQFCILQLMEKNVNSLINILNETNKSIEDYFIGMIVLQYNSNTSEFYKQYINYGFTKSISIKEITTEEVNDDFNLEERIEKDVKEDILLNKIEIAMIKADPFKIDMFKLKYYENMTYKEISEYYNISQKSVINRINSVKNSLKKGLNNDMLFSDLRKKDHELRRIKQGKILITDTIKKEIYDKYEAGNTKISLSKEYEISYPTLLSIIKKQEEQNK